MKIKEWLYLLGFIPKKQTYKSITKPILEKNFTHLKWSEWQHPKAKKVRPRFDDSGLTKIFTYEDCDDDAADGAIRPWLSNMK